MGIQAQESVPPLSEDPVATGDTEETEDFLRAWKFALYSLTSENVLQLFKPTLSPFFCTSLMIPLSQNSASLTVHHHLTLTIRRARQGPST